MKQSKPSIIEVVGRHVHLRKAGKEYIGCCPFHLDKTPSMSVSEQKGLFHCFGCGVSGDVFDFIMRVDGLTFTQAKAALGVNTSQSRKPRRSDALLAEAHNLAAWANQMTSKAEYLLRQVGQQKRLAREFGSIELTGKWLILETLADDLQSKDYLLELYQQRETIEHLLAEGVVEPWPEWPELSPEYRKFVADLPKPPADEVRAHG